MKLHLALVLVAAVGAGGCWLGQPKGTGPSRAGGAGAAIPAGTKRETFDLPRGAELTVTLRERLEVTVTR